MPWNGIGPRARAALAVVALALAATVPVDAHAVGHAGGGCGGSWSRRATCRFYVRGLPIEFSGEAFAETDAHVRVWVDMEPVQGVITPTWEECIDAQDGAYAACDGRIGTAQILDSTKQLFLVRCNVEGSSRGTFRCISGLGI